MLSIHNIIDEINTSLQAMVDCDLAEQKVGIHKVAITQQRNNNPKSDWLPATMDRQGEGGYVGIDDEYAVRLYHKINSISCTLSSKGMGRSPGEQRNVYNISIIVFLNRKRSVYYPDEIVQLIQAWFPDSIKLEPYSSINIFFQNVILSDLQVYNQEYKTEVFLLKPEHNLFLINYQVETVFKKFCFKNCPEGSYY